MTRTTPDSTALADIARGRGVLDALGPFDIGQAAVVIDGHVVAVEDIEGTDGLLARVVRLRAEGRIRAKAGRGVLVKAPKSKQDLRFDLPTIGPRTVEGAAASRSLNFRSESAATPARRRSSCCARPARWRRSRRHS